MFTVVMVVMGFRNAPIHGPRGAATGSHRVLRGGDWRGSACYCRVADRGDGSPTGTSGARDGDAGFGFRVVRGSVP